jgi:F0F1-type ATP synthase membrane subunit b/b'
VLSLAAAVAATQAPDLTPVTPAGFDIWNLIQFGFVGFILVCFMIRKFVVPEWTLRDAERRHDKESASKDAEIASLKDQVERLQSMTEQQMIPALTRTAEIVARYTEEQQRERLRAEARDGRS